MVLPLVLLPSRPYRDCQCDQTYCHGRPRARCHSRSPEIAHSVALDRPLTLGSPRSHTVALRCTPGQWLTHLFCVSSVLVSSRLKTRCLPRSRLIILII